MANSISSTSSASSNPQVVLAQMAALQKNIAEASAKAEEERIARENNANLKGPTGAVQEYQKSNNKSSSNLQAFATDIGILVKNTTRLNVVSTLAANDKVDFFKFRATGTGNAALGMIGDQGLRVQLMSQNGTVIADSDKDSGEAKARYDKLREGSLELKGGQYTLRVTREKGVSDKDKLNYGVQLRMGDYKQDYDTVAKQPKAGDSPYQLPQNVQTLSGMLNDSVSFLSSYQFGQSASDKLTGAVFDGVF